MNPLVSVVIPVWNAERFLAEAIESVLAQTWPHWELLLADDGSTDRSAEIARSWESRHPGKIRCLEHPGRANRGESASRNLGRGANRRLTVVDTVSIDPKRQLLIIRRNCFFPSFSALDILCTS